MGVNSRERAVKALTIGNNAPTGHKSIIFADNS